MKNIWVFKNNFATFLFFCEPFLFSGSRHPKLWDPDSLDWLIHWGRVMHLCISKLTIIGSDNGCSVPSHYLNQWWYTVGTPYNTNVGVQKIPDRAIWKPVVAKRNNTNPWSFSEPQILVTRDSRQVHMAEQPASRDRLESQTCIEVCGLSKFLPSCIHHRLPDNSLISANL